MTAQTAQPLPECAVCDRPTKRDVWDTNDGLCSGCLEELSRARSALGLRP